MSHFKDVHNKLIGSNGSKTLALDFGYQFDWNKKHKGLDEAHLGGWNLWRYFQKQLSEKGMLPASPPRLGPQAQLDMWEETCVYQLAPSVPRDPPRREQAAATASGHSASMLSLSRFSWLGGLQPLRTLRHRNLRLLYLFPLVASCQAFANEKNSNI